MRRIIFYTLSFVFLSVTMSGCKCGSKGPFVPSYQIAVDNKSDILITKYTYLLSFIADMEWTGTEKVPTKSNPCEVYVWEESDLFIRLYAKEEIAFETTIHLKPIPSDGANVLLDLIVNKDGTLTVKEVPSVDPVAPKKTIHF